jgi:hypothetical protein
MARKATPRVHELKPQPTVAKAAAAAAAHVNAVDKAASSKGQVDGPVSRPFVS